MDDFCYLVKLTRNTYCVLRSVWKSGYSRNIQLAELSNWMKYFCPEKLTFQPLLRMFIHRPFLLIRENRQKLKSIYCYVLVTTQNLVELQRFSIVLQ